MKPYALDLRQKIVDADAVLSLILTLILRHFFYFDNEKILAIFGGTWMILADIYKAFDAKESTPEITTDQPIELEPPDQTASKP